MEGEKLTSTALQIPTDDLKEIQSCYMLGVLAVKESWYPPIGVSQEVVTHEKTPGKRVVYYVKPVSNAPTKVSEIYSGLTSDLFIGHDDDQGILVSLPSDFSSMQTREKKDLLYNALEGKLILFQPNIVSDDHREQSEKHVKVFALEGDWGERKFISIPKVESSNEDFEVDLLSSNIIDFKEYNHQMKLPTYILCGDYIYTSKDWVWKNDPTKKTTRVLTKSSKIFKYPVSDIKNHCGATLDHLYFIDTTYLENIDMKIYKEGNGTLLSLIKKDSADESTITHSIENKFLMDLEQLALKNNLYYDFKDILNLHISCKTSFINVLAGMSGTGKTQLAQTYAKALGLTEKNNTLLTMPISPSYTEPGDILGYLNTSIGLFMPSESGLVDLLKHASDYSEQMHVIILEEMNLSQVEYWFAPFISLLELDEDQRNLKLYSEKNSPHNKDAYPHSIKIGNNLCIIGTVNMDETTKDFSDRLLDRANVATLRKMSFVELKAKLNGISSSDNEVLAHGAVYSDTKNYRSWYTSNKPLEAFTDKDLVFFDQLHELINKYDQQKGVSYRILKSIGHYLNHIPINDNGMPYLDKAEALDMLIKQRIMTKIRGSVEQFEKLVGRIDTAGLDIPYDSELYNLFTSPEVQSISTFKRTLNEIVRKAREMSINGYAS